LGVVTLTNDTALNDPNPEYGSLTINAGVTLTVPSGAVLRVNGAFTNAGTISVLPGSAGSVNGGFLDPGQSMSPPTNIGGVGISALSARTILRPGSRAGGGGSGSGGQTGGAGGGSIVILARGAFTNQATATILANGAVGGSASGGGSGGIIVIASPTSITNAGAINAQGGDGGTNIVQGSSGWGVGGGGGGGIVHLISPTFGTLGTKSVTPGLGGAPGANIPPGPMPVISAGGGGGACGGNGGSGGSWVALVGGGVTPQPAPGGAQGPTVGYSFTTQDDPSSLF
jgi:hypothetical protein